MKVRGFLAALLFAALSSVPAGAQALYQGPNFLNFDSNRYLLVRETATPAYDGWQIWSNAINDTISSASNWNSPFSAESTSTLNVSRMRTVTAFIRCFPGAPIDTTQSYTFEVQVRAHPVQSQDSSSTYIWHRARNLVSPGVEDTLGHYYGAGNIYNAGTGTFVIQFANARSGQNQATHRSWNGQAGIYITIASRDGDAFWAPYMSIRVRNLGPNLAPKCRLRMDVAGTPL